MSDKKSSGAGASVSSGASYQARVGAYVIATSLSQMETVFSRFGEVERIGFETREKIDDINLGFINGATCLIQAKSSISFSKKADSDFYSVLSQFHNQYISAPDATTAFILATSSSSSKKIANDLRAALDAFRSETKREFLRDQPKALREIISDIRALLCSFKRPDGTTSCEQVADEIISRSFVFLLDVETNEALEQGAKLVLGAKGFSPPAAVWAKLITDCVGYAKTRRTLTIEEIEAGYLRFKDNTRTDPAPDVERFFELVSNGSDFAVGKELLVCRIAEDFEVFRKGLGLFEFYRFDSDCNERLKFTDSSVKLQNGVEFDLLARASTVERAAQLVEEASKLGDGEEITVYPMNSDDDYEAGPCANLHRARLEAALKSNGDLLKCLHCEQPVSSLDCYMVELGLVAEPVVGLVHKECLSPTDRILGTIHNDFFAAHPTLRNFDLEGWHKALYGGQMALGNARQLNETNTTMLWGGYKLAGPAGKYVVEISLADGASEIVTRRNEVQRFVKAKAHEFVDRMKRQFEQARLEGDPWCYTDQSKGFGKRSLMVEKFGGREKIIEVSTAGVRKYNAKHAARYSRPGSWYAPMAYLQDAETEQPIVVRGSVLMISDPTKLENYLANWREIGIELPTFTVNSLLFDREFDEFMRWATDNGFKAMIDPIFNESLFQRVSGYSLEPIDPYKDENA